MNKWLEKIRKSLSGNKANGIKIKVVNNTDSQVSFAYEDGITKVMINNKTNARG